MTAWTGDQGGRTERVRIRLDVPPSAVPTGPAHVRLAIEDVSLADSAAVAVAELTVVLGPGDDLSGPYELDRPAPSRRSYAIRVHVDRSGDGSVSPGDLLTTTSQYVSDADDSELHVAVTAV